jgi:hypothetical protein
MGDGEASWRCRCPACVREDNGYDVSAKESPDVGRKAEVGSPANGDHLAG